MPDEPLAKVHLSVVATSRNDNHGKNLLYRMQVFVDGFIEQCKRHHLKAELILVEWNPPKDTLPFAQALKFPKDKGSCTVRIIQVPQEVHLKLNHADKIPLFQMIGKNVGIRRALGKFVLATNIDILFSDEVMKFIKNKLTSGCLYRVDRLDIPEKLPQTSSFDELLQYCSKHYFRVNGRLETSYVVKKNYWGMFYQWIKISYRFFLNLLQTALHASIVSILTKTVPCFISNITQICEKFPRLIKRLLCLIYPQNSIVLHTNACGDFTLLSFDDWTKLKGYPEWNMFSWHIDSVLLYQARQHGIKERDLPKAMPIYHIEHEAGSGYSPEGAGELFCRLETKGTPYLNNTALKEIVTQLKHSKEKVTYNSNDWGMASSSLKEFIV